MVTPMPTAGPLTAAITGFKHLKMRSVEGVGAGGKIGAGAKPAARAGDDDRSDIVVLVGLVERVDQLLLHRAVEGIELVGPVQRDGENLFGDLIFDRLI
jgi:hypothetical protein